MLYRKILKAFKSYFTLFDVCRFPSLVLGHHVQCNSLIIFCLILFRLHFRPSRGMAGKKFYPLALMSRDS